MALDWGDKVPLGEQHRTAVFVECGDLMICEKGQYGLLRGVGCAGLKTGVVPLNTTGAQGNTLSSVQLRHLILFVASHKSQCCQQ